MLETRPYRTPLGLRDGTITRFADDGQSEMRQSMKTVHVGDQSNVRSTMVFNSVVNNFVAPSVNQLTKDSGLRRHSKRKSYMKGVRKSDVVGIPSPNKVMPVSERVINITERPKKSTRLRKASAMGGINMNIYENLVSNSKARDCSATKRHSIPGNSGFARNKADDRERDHS